ncbi:MAG: hypothetical protein ACK5YR_21770 [Pirellula sp.]|jgi:hypothetical protein
MVTIGAHIGRDVVSYGLHVLQHPIDWQSMQHVEKVIETLLRRMAPLTDAE